MELVSLIIPNYNKARYISETLNALLSQTYSNWEAIVVDDGSTDDSRLVIDSHTNKDLRFKSFYLNHSIYGGSVCRNFGLSKAKGEYVIFLDSDDLLTPNCLENRIHDFIKNDGLNFLVYGMGSFIKKIGDNDYTWMPTKTNVLARFLSHELPWAICQPIWKRDFLEDGQFRFDESLARLQDVDFHAQVMLSSPNFEVYGIKDCYYRVDPNRIVSSNYDFNQKKVEAVNYFVQKYAAKISVRKSWLNKSILFTLSSIGQEKLAGKISSPEYSQLCKMLLSNTNGILTRWILNSYSQLFRIFNFYVPGIRKLALTLLNFTK